MAAVLTPVGGEVPPPGGLRAALREPRVLAGAWLTTLPTLCYGVFGVLVPLRLSELGVGAAGVALVFLMAAAAEAPVSPFAGRLADRRGPLVPIRAGLVGLVATAVLMPLPQRPWLLAAVVVAGATFSGVLLTPASALLSDGAESAGAPQGLVFGLFNLAWAIGQVVGSAGGARLADATSDAVPYVDRRVPGGAHPGRTRPAPRQRPASASSFVTVFQFRTVRCTPRSRAFRCSIASDCRRPSGHQR